jgi:hypothetical protein
MPARGPFTLFLNDLVDNTHRGARGWVENGKLARGL